MLPWLAAALLVCGRGSGAGRRWPAPATGPCGSSGACALAALVAIGLNPVHVAVTPGPVHRPEVHVLLDASQSMRLGSPESRWQEGTALLRDALDRQEGHADVRVHRFGERLVAGGPGRVPGGRRTRPARTTPTPSWPPRSGNWPAGSAARRRPAVVVVSDGRVRDPEKLDEMASLWRRLRVPVHVVPVGRAAEGGDVAIVAAVAPAKARKQAQVTVDVFLRSFGFAGRRAELQLQALDENGNVRRNLTTLPVTLQDGVQPLTVAFRTEPDLKRLRLHVPPPPGDLSPVEQRLPAGDRDSTARRSASSCSKAPPSPGWPGQRPGRGGARRRLGRALRPVPRRPARRPGRAVHRLPRARRAASRGGC